MVREVVGQELERKDNTDNEIKGKIDCIVVYFIAYRLCQTKLVHCFMWRLTLAGCQVPTKAALSLPSSAGQGRENAVRGSWVGIRAGGSPPVTIMGKTDLTWGNWFITNQKSE